MPIEYAGRGDAVQTLTLLWRMNEGGRRGPKRRLNLDQIVAAAIEIADTEGLDALSMRRVAERLEVGTMTLYRYVPSKGELLDLMLDAATGEDPVVDKIGWTFRQKLNFFARQSWAHYHRHPWILQVANARPVLGPETMKHFEAALVTLSGYGLSYHEIESTLTTIENFVRGVARESVEEAQAERVTGIPNDKWWSERNWFWERIFNPDAYPTLTRIYMRGEMNQSLTHEAKFEFGLQRLLDGFDQFIAAAPHPAGDAPPATPYDCE